MEHVHDMGKQIAVSSAETTGQQRSEITQGGRQSANQAEQSIPRQPEKVLRRRSVIILSVLVIVMAGASTLLFVKYRHASANNPARQQKQLTEQLSQVIEMPSEQPIVSTVLDKSKLTNPALASRAHNGDTLFIFPKSKRLILYRPADKKVVDMLNIQP